MLTCCEKVRRFASGEFTGDELRFDAILRNLEVMGEAAKRVPDEVRQRMPSVDWRGLAGLRDVLIHSYSGVDGETIVDIVRRKVPPLEAELRRYLDATA
ncbi:MAG TPA: HepT-like ribonuclease domain-containing protein [Planctomycetota bacterium]|nr:HepT-like ribonuclease domain-containing protein [Planctomycetota bacterium]